MARNPSIFISYAFLTPCSRRRQNGLPARPARRTSSPAGESISAKTGYGASATSPLPSGERDGVRGNRGRFTKYWYVCISLIILGFFLSGCPKKVVKIPPIEVPPVRDPVAKLLDAFSSAESLQAKASIRIDTVRKGEELKFLLNGVVLYKKPDKIRILGYHPFGMGVFDVLYRGGEFLIFSPLQNRAYTGEISEYRDLIAKADIRISTEKPEGSEVPDRIRIEMPEKATRVDVKLKEISINSSLSEDAFQWDAPEGVEIKPLAQFLKGKKLE
jgi:outer membrane lipoprotein-sorting protein